METSIVFPTDPEMNMERDCSGVRPFSIGNSSTRRQRRVFAIVATDSEGAIGRGGEIPWRLPEDLRHFKELTMGHPVIMGRKTWESLPRRPLPGRRNIVLTRDPHFSADGAERAASPEHAVSLCAPDEVPFFIGGGEIYRQSIHLFTDIELTEVKTTSPGADTFFPKLSEKEWVVAGDSGTIVSEGGLQFRYISYRRKDS